MTLEMVILQFCLPTGVEKSDTNPCKSVRKEAALPAVVEVNGSGKH